MDHCSWAFCGLKVAHQQPTQQNLSKKFQGDLKDIFLQWVSSPRWEESLLYLWVMVLWWCPIVLAYCLSIIYASVVTWVTVGTGELRSIKTALCNSVIKVFALSPGGVLWAEGCVSRKGLTGRCSSLSDLCSGLLRSPTQNATDWIT